MKIPGTAPIAIAALALLSLGFGEQTLAQTRKTKSEKTITLCTTSWLMRREGSEFCWVRQLENDYSLCIPKDLWREKILPNLERPVCGAWRGKWRFSSTLSNSADGRNAKERLLRFSVRGFSEDAQHRTSSLLLRLRHRIELTRERLSQWIAPYDPLGVCRHLLLTEKTPGNASSLLRELGFVHLLTATGIHLYALAMWSSRAFQVLAHLLGRVGFPPQLCLHASRAAAWTCWLWAWLISGGRPGMLRPWLIIVVREIGRILGFRWRKWAPLAIALAADLGVALMRSLFDLPGAWAPGRWIYALAVGGGMLTLEYTRGKGSLQQHWHLAVGSWVLVAIFEVAFFQVTALATPVLSLLTIPLFCSSLYPALLSATVFDFFGFESLARTITEWTSWLSSQAIILLFQCVSSARTLWVVPPSAVAAGAALASLLVVFSYSGKTRLRVLVTTITLTFLMKMTYLNPRPNEPAREAYRIEQLDVGQGDAALVYTSEGIGMVDTGSENTISESSWIRLFAARGITQLSWVMLTHQDEDHAGGLRKLKTLMPVSTWAPPFPILGPHRQGKKGANREMSSIFIPLMNGGFYLSAGDSSAKDELRVGNWAKGLAVKLTDSACDFPRILKVSHHGSRFSTSAEFLSLIRPSKAWISSGTGNPYGHPTSQVLRTLRDMRIPIQRTDLQGSLKAEACHRRSP